MIPGQLPCCPEQSSPVFPPNLLFPVRAADSVIFGLPKLSAAQLRLAASIMLPYYVPEGDLLTTKTGVSGAISTVDDWLEVDGGPGGDNAGEVQQLAVLHGISGLPPR